MLVKIGDFVINTDKIVTISEEGDKVVVYLSGGKIDRVVSNGDLKGFIEVLNSIGVTVHG